IPETLLESEIFGHEKGAFTGASDRRQGCFELADRGTLFLDEIGEMTPATQVKLLRVLQERKFRRLGGRAEQSVDVRVIAATNIDPVEAVKAGKLREDLYYRLNVFSFRLPTLRERKEDLPVLVEEPPVEQQPQLALAPGTTVEEAERRLIMMTLAHTRDNKTRAAEILGISLKTLHNKLNKLRLRPKKTE